MVHDGGRGYCFILLLFTSFKLWENIKSLEGILTNNKYFSTLVHINIINWTGKSINNFNFFISSQVRKNYPFFCLRGCKENIMEHIVNIIVNEIDSFFVNFSLRNKLCFVNILQYHIIIPIDTPIQPYLHLLQGNDANSYLLLHPYALLNYLIPILFLLILTK